jgi:hypothetical protein
VNYLDDPSIDPVVGDPDDPTTVWQPDYPTLPRPVSDLCAGSGISTGEDLCTRHPGHKGAHAFGSGITILKVWA